MADTNNLSYMVEDLLEGDEEVAVRRDFSEAELEELRTAYKFLLERAKEQGWSDRKLKLLTAQSWKINYWQKPPTIEEFLTEDWIGEMADSIYPYIRSILTEFWDTDSSYRKLFLSTSIGFGKSTLVVLSNLFTVARIFSMRNPKHFFGLAPSTVLAAVLISFTQDQAKKLLMQPFLNILESAEMFRRTRTEEQMIRYGKEDRSRIYWTTGGTYPLQFYNSLSYAIAADPSSLLGMSILTGSITELSFFREKGISEETISQIYNNLEGRIYSRFQDRWLSSMMIDSSPNSMDTAMDKYIFSGEAAKDPRNYVVTGPKWEWQPELFPDYDRDNSKVFPVFRGTSSRPPMIVDPKDVDQYNPEEIFWVPDDVRHLFERDLVRNLKDYAGWPAGSDDKLISDYQVLEDMFSSQLQNIYSYITAPADETPEKLIWNQIRNKFFVHVGHGSYELVRNPREVRYIAVDQSVANDFTGITMVHPEMNDKGEFVFVLDFTLNIVPGRKRINLQAIEEFIRDLKRYGRVNVGAVSFDQFQSENTKQQLKRDGFDVEAISVDRTMAPYLDFISLMNNRRVKVGRNIFLKNNLTSLQVVTSGTGKKKIDHVQLGTGKVVSEDGGNWTTSKMGHGAKDVSDSAAAAVALCKLKYKRTAANYLWEEDQEIAVEDGSEEPSRAAIMDQSLENVRRKFGLVARKPAKPA